MAIQIGKYKRPGIFIEEYDKSVIPTPTSVDPLVNMVIGVSKKGPVNAPVKVSTLNEFRAIYGEIDRNLERKGSFFHRTIEKMLESSPVYAMNLLLTDDVLDRVEYQSLSTSSDNVNDAKRLGAFRKFHDTTGFWKKDTESFINFTRSNPGFGTRALNITNLSDKPVSVFIYKSTVGNYDITAESWFGSVEKVPAFINPKDFISDYMVDVLIVSGDWSNYRALAQDKIWSNYFFYDTKLGSGLRKNLVGDFANNRNVNVLGYYNGLSLIPYFRNRENKNLFIETNLNADTDKTGIFCAFNIDAVENENVSSLIDLVGHTIANKNETAIDFLSYQANISEEVPVRSKPLDLPGNVTANLGGMTFSVTTSAVPNQAFNLLGSGISTYNILTTRSQYQSTNIKPNYPLTSITALSNQSHFYPPVNGAPTYSGVQKNYTNRTSHFADFTTFGVKYMGYTTANKNTYTDAKLASITNFRDIVITYHIHSNAYVVINGEYLPILNQGTTVVGSNYRAISFSISSSDFEAVGSNVQLFMSTVLYDYETNMIVHNVNKTAIVGGANGVIGVTANDIVLNTFKFRIKGDNNSQNAFIPFNAYQKYDFNGVTIEGRYSPIIISGLYGYNKWVNPSATTNPSVLISNPATPGDFSKIDFHGAFANQWLNNYGNFVKADSYLNVEEVNVDTSFLSYNSDICNPLIHDNSSYIKTFYKNSPTKAYLDDDQSAPIGAVGNQKFTGGSFSTIGLAGHTALEKSGHMYDAMILSYSNVDSWDYASLVPIFATGSNSQSGSCKFYFDELTEQLYASYATSTTFNSSVMLNSGDLVSIWVLDTNKYKTVLNAVTSFSVAHDNLYFNVTPATTGGTNVKPVLLIVDRIDYSKNRIYFLCNRNQSSPYTILHGVVDTGRSYLIDGLVSFSSATDLTRTATGLVGVSGTTTAQIVSGLIPKSITVAGVTWTFNVKIEIPLGTSTANLFNAGTGATTITIQNLASTAYPNMTSSSLQYIKNSDIFPANSTITISNTELNTALSLPVSGLSNTFTAGNLTLTLTSTGVGKIFINQASTIEYTLEKVENNLFDYRVSYEGSGKIKYTFLGTDNAKNPANYRAYRRHRMFDRLVNMLDSVDKYKRVMLLDNDTSNRKVSMENMSISNIVTSPTQNKSFILNTNLPNSEIVKRDWQKVLQGFLTIYSTDDEIILGRNGMDTKLLGVTASVVASDPLVGDGIGVVSKYSDLYQNYYNGNINNGDYFQINRVPSKVYSEGDGYTVTFFDGEEDKNITGLNTGKTTLFAGYNFIMFTASFPNPSPSTPETTNDMKFNIGDAITISNSTLNRKRITIISDNLISSNAGSSTLFTDMNGATLETSNNISNSTIKTYIYKVVEEVAYEKIYGVTKIIDNRPQSTPFLNMFVQDKTESGVLIKDSLSIRFKDSYSLLNTLPPLSNLTSMDKFSIISQSSNYKQTLELEYPATYDSNGTFQIGTSKDTELIDNEDGTWLLDNKVLVKGDRYTEIRVGDFLLGTNNRLSRILDKRVYTKDSSLVILTCSLPIRRNKFGNDWQTYLYKSVDNYTYAYKALTFKGFKVRPQSLPNGTEKTQEDILNIVAKGTPLYRALTNKEAIDYRYLVDSFGLGLGERSKQQLADICGSRKDIFGFLNMPSVRSFKTSTSPTYVDGNGDLVAEYIAKGSNPDKAAEFIYSFADGEGSTCVGYFTPYIKVDDEGRQATMPPAAHVATTYMRKHTSNLGGITPWTIAAGVTNGRITNIIGLEHDYTNEDIEFLNQAQMNPIVFKRNRGHVIETENTAQTLQRSALSFIHVREVLIELERELSRMLLDFQWQYNTPDIRAEIKLRADSICETYVNRNGLYNYFNKMDDENNTSEIIDNQIGVLDTYVEPIKGMGIIVNNVTILRTGAIDAGGFM